MNDGAPPPTSVDPVRIRGTGYTAEAGWFGPEDRPRFGWLYRPDTPASNGVGVVIVPPFGSEDMRAHRTLRHLAQDIASAGFISLRFDPDGCGDSAGDDADPARMHAWIDSVGDACDLARSTGATQLMLIGVRLGAALAVLAASRRNDVTALVAFNAVVKGRQYLRELRAFSQAMALPAPPVSMNWHESGQEAGGFHFNAETRDDIQALDLETVDIAPAPRALLLERDDMPASSKWAEHLAKLDVDVTKRRIPGYVGMMNHPHANRIAQDFIDACIGYAEKLPARQEATFAPADRTLRPSITICPGDESITEEATCIDGQLFAILSQPLHATPTEAVLMLNVGANRHVGSNRTDVPLARYLAMKGRLALRADLSGIGDSPPRAGETENIVYSQRATSDVKLLVQALRARGAEHITAGGMCSGAYHALYAAIAGLPIQTLYLVNCGAFGTRVDFNPDSADLFNSISHYNRSIKSPQSWRKLLAGKVAIGSVIRVFRWHATALVKRVWRELATRLRLPLHDNLGATLMDLSRKGTRIHFLFAGDEPGLMQLRAETGSVVPRLCRAGQFSMRTFARADHTFTQRWAQAQLREALNTILAPQP